MASTVRGGPSPTFHPLLTPSPSKPKLPTDTLLLAYLLIQRLAISNIQIEEAIKENRLTSFLTKRKEAATSLFLRELGQHAFVLKIFERIYPKITRLDFEKFLVIYADCEKIFINNDVDDAGNLTFISRHPTRTLKSSVENYQTVIKAIDELRMKYLKCYKILELEGCLITINKILFIAKIEQGHLELLIGKSDIHQNAFYASAIFANLTRGLNVFVKIAATPEEEETDAKMAFEQQAKAVEVLYQEIGFLKKLHKRAEYLHTGCPWAISPYITFDITRTNPSDERFSHQPFFCFATKYFKNNLHDWTLKKHSPQRRLEVCKNISQLFAAVANEGVVLRAVKPTKVLFSTSKNHITRMVVSDFGGAKYLSEIEQESLIHPIEFTPRLSTLSDIEAANKLRRTPKAFAKFLADKIIGFSVAVILFQVATKMKFPYPRLKTGKNKGNYDPEGVFNVHQLAEYPVEFRVLLEQALNQKNPELRPSPQALAEAMDKIAISVTA